MDYEFRQMVEAKYALLAMSWMEASAAKMFDN